VLNREGKVAQQGNFHELQKQDRYISSLLVGAARGTEETTTRPNPPSKKKPVIKGITQNDVTDLTRKTGDLAVYKYYFKSINRPGLLSFLVCTALFVFGTYFPRKSILTGLCISARRANLRDRILACVVDRGRWS
jgi:ATP-binding cassette subfamily C (CFTR/MRP) protein 1